MLLEVSRQSFVTSNSFDPKPVHVSLVVGIVATGQVILRILLSSAVTIISPKLTNHFSSYTKLFV